MKTKTIDLYEFDELPDNIKAKVLDKNRYINVDGDWWYDYDGKTGFSSDEIKKYDLDIEEAGDLLNFDKVYFDLGRGWYIQFDGASFAHDETARRFLGVPEELWEVVRWEFSNKNYSGSSHGTTKIEYEHVDSYGFYQFTPEEVEILDRAVERFAEKMEEALRNLEKDYEYQTSDEAIIETILANEYTFRADGKMENE